jgi:signal transduction histidine kinase
VSKSKKDVSGLIVLLRDVSELRKLQKLASRNSRMQELGEMAAMVAHEIRNPLGGIKGYASLLERDLAEQPHLKEMASYIIQGTDDLNRLVSRVLYYARPVHVDLRVTDLMALIKEVEEHIRADAALNPLCEIVIQKNSPSAILPLDPHLIKSALFNLIVNAMEAMPGGGRISITAAKTEEQAIVAVSDTGHGIPKQNLEKIFSPFFTTKPHGSGFGLSEVHKNIQLHGGTIAVVSQEKIGTTFTIFLPLYPLRYEEGHEKIMIFDF